MYPEYAGNMPDGNIMFWGCLAKVAEMHEMEYAGNMPEYREIQEIPNMKLTA